MSSASANTKTTTVRAHREVRRLFPLSLQGLQLTVKACFGCGHPRCEKRPGERRVSRWLAQGSHGSVGRSLPSL